MCNGQYNQRIFLRHKIAAKYEADIKRWRSRSPPTVATYVVQDLNFKKITGDDCMMRLLCILDMFRS
jgi:hypothetical protein